MRWAAHRSMTGLAMTRRSRASIVAAVQPGGNSTRRPVAAAGHWNDQLRCGVADRVGIGVGDARMQGDLDGVVVVAGDGPCRRLQQRIDEEGGEAIALLVDEFTLDEGDVAHDDRTG